MSERTVEQRIADLESKAEKVLAEIESSPERAADLKAQVTDISKTLDDLRAEKAERDRDREIKSLREEVTTLTDALKQLRTAPGIFGDGKSVRDEDVDSIYGPGTGHSFYADVHNAKYGGSPAAIERMAKALGAESTEDIKAMSNLSEAAGGYLVNPQISNELIRLRLQAARLRPLFSSIDVQSDSLQIASITGGLTAGWVAELAAKPTQDMTFGQLSVSVFTGAGLATVSNQLLADARPSIDGLVNEELARRLAILEEIAFINGSGTGQPLGILGTAGVISVTLTPTAVLDLLDAIYEGISQVQQQYFGDPTEIVMHPRTWARIVKARESGTTAQYIIGSGANSGGRRGSDGVPQLELFGYRVVLTNNIPTNLGAGTNESRVIVGNFREGLILDRQGVTLDSSEHVNFTTNATVFRGEERVGFTAGRYPKAFAVVQGAGLAAG